jgi:glycosyltransferase involved in cell wall biosynthesis
MKLLMLLQKDFPPDIRVEKEAKSLIKAGFEVHLLCKNSISKEDEKIQGIAVHRIKPRSKILFIRKLINFPLFFNPFWAFQAWRIVKNENIRIIHAHDLPMVPLALLFTTKQIKVIFDMHENYPEALKVWGRNDMLSKVTKNPNLALLLENYVCRKVDSIIVVVEEQKERLLKLGLSENEITVVSNRVDTKEFKELPIDQRILKNYKEDFILLYAGSFAKDRGLEVPILALVNLVKSIMNIKLLFVGDGPNRNELEDLVKTKGLDNFVEFLGWLPFAKMPSYMNLASVCLIPQPSNPFIDTTIPHKLFQYMVLRKPIIVSDAKPLARYVKELGAGEVFQSGSVESFEQAVLTILNRKKSYYLIDKHKMSGLIDWAKDEKSLIDLYTSILV